MAKITLEKVSQKHEALTSELDRLPTIREVADALKAPAQYLHARLAVWRKAGEELPEFTPGRPGRVAGEKKAPKAKKTYPYIRHDKDEEAEEVEEVDDDACAGGCPDCASDAEAGDVDPTDHEMDEQPLRAALSVLHACGIIQVNITHYAEGRWVADVKRVSDEVYGNNTPPKK